MNSRSTIRAMLAIAAASAVSMVGASPLLAAELQDPGAAGHSGHAAASVQTSEEADPPSEPAQTVPSQPSAEHGGHAGAQPMDMKPAPQNAPPAPMDMGSMQGGRAPADARDPNAYADGYVNSTLPGFEKTDKLPVSFFLADQLEFVSGKEGDGFAWSGQFARGGDNDKLWLRTQGLRAAGALDPESGAEALWWHAYSPFWGTTLGVRQDIGRGAHTWLAFGIEGMAPYWFKLELTGYVSDSANVGARIKASYDVLLTNRLIATPSVESNVYAKDQKARGVGSGISNVEVGLRLRYEISRKFAPYAGFVWERSFGETADFRRVAGEAPSERRFVAGIRLWW